MRDTSQEGEPCPTTDEGQIVGEAVYLHLHHAIQIAIGHDIQDSLARLGPWRGINP